MYFGLIFLALSPVAYLFSRRKERLAGQMKSGQVIPINQVQPNMPVEVYGTATSSQPLLTPFTRQPCVYYDYEITRQVHDRDSQGRTSSRRERVHGDHQSTPFWIQDQTGSIAVYPDGANIDARPLGERLLTAADSRIGGAITSIVAGLVVAPAMVKERALLLNQPVYAYGTAVKTEQGAALTKGSGDMVLSYRTEAEAEKTVMALKRNMMVLAVVLAVIGIALIIYSVTR